MTMYDYNGDIQNNTTRENNMYIFKMNEEIINDILFCVEQEGFDTLSAWVKFEKGLHFVHDAIAWTLLMDYGIIYAYQDNGDEEYDEDELGDALEWLLDREERKERLGF